MSVYPNYIFINRFFWPDRSATAQLLADLAFDLARSGGAVTVITSRLRYDEPSGRLPVAEKVDGVRVVRVATTGFGRATLIGRAFDLGSFYVMALIALYAMARAGDVIVAKTDPPLLSIFVRPIARLKHARLINWLQDLYPEVASVLGVPGLNAAAGRLLRACRNASLRAADQNVVLGERMAARLRDEGVHESRIRIIPNWSDEQAIAPLSHEHNPLRTTWGLQGKFVVGYSGNLGRAHECETMLGAAADLRDEPAIAFLMVGDGHHTTALRERAQQAGLTNIVFQPYQPREALAASLSAADLHWISLKPELEGLIVPSKVYGILAAGRPVLAIGDADGEIARLVREHCCGLHAASGDFRRFAQIVRELAASPELAISLGQAARRAATSCFSKATALGAWRETVLAAATRAASLESRSGSARLAHP